MTTIKEVLKAAADGNYNQGELPEMFRAAAVYVDHLAQCDKRRVQAMPMQPGQVYTNKDCEDWLATLRCTCGFET